MVSIRILVHPPAPGVVHLPAEEDPIIGHLAGWEERGSGISVLPVRHDVPGWRHPTVHHAGEPHVPGGGDVRLDFKVKKGGGSLVTCSTR